MNSNFRNAMREFDDEVEQEAATLIRDGYAAPFDAIRLARETVTRRRREQVYQQSLTPPTEGT